MKLKDLRRIGAALLTTLGVIAPAVNIAISPEDAAQAVEAFDALVMAGSGFFATVLTLWSKFVDGKRK